MAALHSVAVVGPSGDGRRHARPPDVLVRMCAWRCTFTTSIYEGGPRPGSCGRWWPLQTMGVSPPLLTVAFFCRPCLSSARMVRPTRPMGRCHEVADACDRPSVSSLAVQSVLCGVGGGAGCLPTPLPLWPCTGGSVSRACPLWPRRGRAVRPSAAPQPVGWPVHERCPRAWAWPLSRATGWMGRIAPVMHFGIARPFLF